MTVPFPLPAVAPETETFWTGGADGRLRITACNACDHRIHPPQLICPRCLSRDVEARPASGKGTVATFTINRQAWVPGLAVPYAIGIVELDDQPGVRITARILAETVECVAIGAAVEVAFEKNDDVFIPVFRLV
ncbi:MAG: OB-fold domain-containing protein [Novosphingobium sp.]|nr:OB-fold domain-containing protein [Novosphingobium sp.]